MRCYALGFIADKNSSANWSVAKKYDGFFVNGKLYAEQKKLIALYESLEMNHYKIIPGEKFTLCALKTRAGSCMVVSDRALTNTQIVNLLLWLGEGAMSLDAVVSNFENCINTQPKLYEIAKTLEETKQIMLNNIELTMRREVKLDQLSDTSIKVAHQAKKLNEQAEELTDCCDRCTLF